MIQEASEAEISRIKNIDWEIYLERKQPFFIFSSSLRLYGSMLQSLSGISFTEQLYWFKNDSGVCYRSKKEMEAVDRHLLELVRSKDTRVFEWAAKGNEYNAEADHVLSSFSSSSLHPQRIAELSELWEMVMLYSAIIPYRILSAINYALEQGESKSDFLEILEIYEALRGTTKYPQLIDVVFSEVWKHIAESVGANDTSVYSCLFIEELNEWTKNNALPSEEILVSRKKGSLFWLSAAGENVIDTKEETANILSSLHTSEELSEVRGKCAYEGFVCGRVCIINDIKDGENFQEGDVVVSINTSPSLMPFLIKCSAIVTDEGGIMCHAAIVSRELKKPCIIGTKQATKVFKNGDYIEVDASSGIAQKISLV